MEELFRLKFKNSVGAKFASSILNLKQKTAQESISPFHCRRDLRRLVEKEEETLGMARSAHNSDHLARQVRLQ